MIGKEIGTRENILQAAKKEFLENGFQQASLRSIVKNAGVTTGAFYGYFQSKEALFRSLVEIPAKTCLSKFSEAQKSFAALPPAEQLKQTGKASEDCINWIVDYVYNHFDAFKLILCCAQGTEYQNYIDALVEIEIESTHQFVSCLKNIGFESRQIDRQLEHILVNGLFSGFFEIVVHDMPKTKAVEYVRELREFYTAGWQKIMGL